MLIPEFEKCQLSWRECVKIDNDTILKSIEKIDDVLDLLATEQLYRPLGDTKEDGCFNHAVGALCTARHSLLEFVQAFASHWLNIDCDLEPFNPVSPADHFYDIVDAKREAIWKKMRAEYGAKKGE